MWFKEVKGYNLGMCREFYQELAVFGDDGSKSRTNVRGKAFEVTLDTIATAMAYARPPTSTPVHPHNVDGGKDPLGLREPYL